MALKRWAGPDQDSVDGSYTARETGIHYVAVSARHGDTGPYPVLAFEHQPDASVSEPSGTDFTDWRLNRTEVGSVVRTLNNGARYSIVSGYLAQGLPATGTLDSHEDDETDS